MQGFMIGNAAEQKNSALAAFFASSSCQMESGSGFAAALAEALQGPLAYLRANGITVFGERRPLFPALARAAENLAGHLNLPLTIDSERPDCEAGDWIRAVLRRATPESIPASERVEAETLSESSTVLSKMPEWPEGTLVVQPVEETICSGPSGESPLVLILEPEQGESSWPLPRIDGKPACAALWVIPRAVSEKVSDPLPEWVSVLTSLIPRISPWVGTETGFAVNGDSEPAEWTAALLGHEGEKTVLVFPFAATERTSGEAFAESSGEEVVVKRTDTASLLEVARPEMPSVALVFQLPQAAETAADSFENAVPEGGSEQLSPASLPRPVSQATAASPAVMSLVQLESLAQSADQPIPVLVRVDAPSGEVLIRPRVDAPRQDAGETTPIPVSGEAAFVKTPSVPEREPAVVSISTRSAPELFLGEKISGGEAASDDKVVAEPKSAGESVPGLWVKAVLAGQPERSYRVSTAPITFHAETKPTVLGERQVPETEQLRQVMRLLESLSGSIEQVRVTAVSRPERPAISLVSPERPIPARADLGRTGEVPQLNLRPAVQSVSSLLPAALVPEEEVANSAFVSPEVQVKPVSASGYSALRDNGSGFRVDAISSSPQPVFVNHRIGAMEEPPVLPVQPVESVAAARDSQPAGLYRATAEISQIPLSQQGAVGSPSGGTEEVSVVRAVHSQTVASKPPIQPGDVLISSDPPTGARVNQAPGAEAVKPIAGDIERMDKPSALSAQARPDPVVTDGVAESLEQPVRKGASTPAEIVSRIKGIDLPQGSGVRAAMSAVEGIRPFDPVLPFRQPEAAGQSPIPSTAPQSGEVHLGTAQAVVVPSEQESAPAAIESPAQPLTMRKPGPAGEEPAKELQSPTAPRERGIVSAEQTKLEKPSASPELRMPEVDIPNRSTERTVPGKDARPMDTPRPAEPGPLRSVKLNPEQVAEGLEAARRESVQVPDKAVSSEKSVLANSPSPRRLAGRSEDYVPSSRRESGPVEEVPEKTVERSFETERPSEELRPRAGLQRDEGIEADPRLRPERIAAPRTESIHSRPESAAATAPMPGKASSAVSAARELAQMERIATALDEQRTIQQVAEQAKTLAGQNRGEIRMQLQPDQLGRLRMLIGVEDGVVRARIVTETAEARAMLERHLPDLKLALGDQGLRVQEVRLISAGTGEQSLSGFEGQSHSHRQAGTQQEHRSAGANDSSSWLPDRQPRQERQSQPHADRWRNYAATGRVDYRA